MANEQHQELVIIKRHSDHDDGHHGGAWKIAFADFMTAMMALFLVLWLISATTPKMRVVIARYFNPVKLAEVTADKKGLNDPVDGGKPARASSAKADDTKEKRLELPPLPQEKRSLFDLGAASSRHDEAAMFRDPYAVLSEIAAQPGGDAKSTQTGGGAEPKPDGSAAPDPNESFRDPFMTVPQGEQVRAANQQAAAAPAGAGPSSWNEDASGANNNQVAGASGGPAAAEGGQSTFAGPVNPVKEPDASSKESGSKGPNDMAPAPKPAASMQAATLPSPSPSPSPSPAPAPTAAGPAPAPAAASGKEKAGASGKEAAKGQARGGATEQTMSPQAAAEARAQLAAADIRSNEAEAGKLQNELASAVRRDAAAQIPNVEVKSTAEGVLISLTDENNYAMFAVGSAEPQKKTVEVMEKVAQLLKGRSGQIVVRGHTDGRPYKSGSYDNWQLSAARAQMAHYMLVHGGLDEKRIERIEGYADHQLKLPNDPLNAENRRIEILLRKAKP